MSDIRGFGIRIWFALILPTSLGRPLGDKINGSRMDSLLRPLANVLPKMLPIKLLVLDRDEWPRRQLDDKNIVVLLCF